MNVDFSENALVEQPSIALPCFKNWTGRPPTACMKRLRPALTLRALILIQPWPGNHERCDPAAPRAAIERLNPDIASDAVQLAMVELAKDRSAMEEHDIDAVEPLVVAVLP
jgi:hypothetical protein